MISLLLKKIFIIIDIIIKISIFFLSFWIISNSPFLILTYEATEYGSDILIIYEFNFFGGFFKSYYSNINENPIPHLYDEWFPVATFIYCTYFVIAYSNLFIGNLNTTIFIKSKKKKAISIILLFSFYIFIYIILPYFNYFRISEMVETARIYYEQEKQIIPDIERSYVLSLEPYFMLYYLYPLIFILLGFFCHYFLYKNLVDKNRHLIYDDDFMRSFIKKVKDDYTENDYWDFKQILEWWKPKCAVKEEKQIEFCEKVACFANTGGGLIIIGITNKYPREIIGIDDIEYRIKNLHKVLRKSLGNKNKFYHIRELPLKDDTNIIKRCILIAIY